MSEMYNLRSNKRKKSVLDVNCYLKNKSSKALNPYVCLERLKLSEFNSPNIVVKDSDAIKPVKPKKGQNKYFWIYFCFFILCSSLCLVYYKYEVQFYGASIAKKFDLIRPCLKNFLDILIAQKYFVKSLIFKGQDSPKSTKLKFTVQENHSNMETSQDDIDVMKIVEEEFMKFKSSSKFRNFTEISKSFIQEQCKIEVKHNFKTVLDESSLTDYALESLGAEIVSVFDTEPYGIKAIKFLNFNIQPLLSYFLRHSKCFSKNEANAILSPWKKPGDCWAFKGSQGRVQIKLSEKIFITAIAVDHIPKEFTQDGNIESAPRKFSVFGIQEAGMQTRGQSLGTFEYKIMGPSTQTFLVLPKPTVSFRWIEVSIESNHGNVNYTCIYKIRVHGHK